MPSLPHRILQRLKAWLLNSVQYQDQLRYRLDAQAGLVATSKAAAKVLLLSRHCYTEQLQWLPVNRKAEAVKLLNYQLAARTAPSFYLLGAAVDGKTPVLWYQLKADIEPGRAWLVVPETLLVGLVGRDGEVLSYQTPDRKLPVFVTQTHAGSVSAVKGAVLQTPEQFMLAQGVNQTASRTLTTTEHRQYLIENLFKLPRIPLTGLINKAAFQHQSNLKPLAQRFLWPFVITISLYLILAQQWTQYQLEQNRTALQQASVEANVILQQRDDIEQKLSQYQLLQSALPENADLLQLWAVIAPLYQQQITVQHLQQRQQQVTLRIEAISATEALQLLVSQPAVTNARLDGNVRRQGDREIATMSFTLHQEPM